MGSHNVLLSDAYVSLLVRQSSDYEPNFISGVFLGDYKMVT